MGVRVPLPGPKQHLYPGVAELVDARNYVDPVDFEKQMKYGIRITHQDGTIEYAYAAKGGRIGVTDDITETALFAQEDTAIKALKQARKNGFESTNKVVLDVIGVEYTVVQSTKVDQPPKKDGFVLTVIRHNRWAKTDERTWFSGPKKSGSYINWDLAVESATVFPSDLEAQAKIAECREEHEEKIVRCEAEIKRGFYGFHAANDKQRWEHSKKQELQGLIDHRQWFDTIEIAVA